jgi:iodothyronine deiodinase-like protein
MASNDRAGVIVPQPRSLAERNAIASICCAALEISMPLLVDDLDDRIDETYAAFPDRLYVIDRAGRVAYKGGRGPFGFDPREMETALILTLLEERERAF